MTSANMVRSAVMFYIQITINPILLSSYYLLRLLTILNQGPFLTEPMLPKVTLEVEKDFFYCPMINKLHWHTVALKDLLF
jgi:hypothetical protein